MNDLTESLDIGLADFSEPTILILGGSESLGWLADVIRRRLSIDGSTVSALLLQDFKPDEVWVLKDIETLSGADAKMLGDLWQRSRSAPISPERRTRLGGR